MPADTSYKAMRMWHLAMLRTQHASIADALSGERLDAFTECVQIAIEGTDVAGKQLAVRDAAAVSAWLPTLRGSNAACVLLTAGPAWGKTWLLSQVVVHALDSTLVPILIEVQHLQRSLTANEAAFAAAADWVEAYLRLTTAPPQMHLSPRRHAPPSEAVANMTLTVTVARASYLRDIL